MRIGRNELCPCGSRKRYKNCCMGMESKTPILSDKQLEKRIEYFRKKARKDPLKAMRSMSDTMQAVLHHGLANWKPNNFQESVELFLCKQAEQIHNDTELCLRIYFEQLALSYNKIHDKSQGLAVVSRMNWWDRTLTRSFFTEVEGILFLVQKVVLWAVDRGEIAVELEDSMRHNVGDGPYMPMLKTFKEAFSCFTRLGQNSIDYQDNGWAKFKRSHEYRNSFTHPKTTSDIGLPMRFIEETLFPGMIWYRDQLRSLGILACNHSLCNKSLHEIKLTIMSILPRT